MQALESRWHVHDDETDPSESRALPEGVTLTELNQRPDRRGALAEIYRAEWATGCEAVQWNALQSVAGTLRGVRVHALHADYFVVLTGRMLLGLHDIRTDSKTYGRSRMVTLDGEAPFGLTVPAGVCHGLYFPIATVAVQAVSHTYDPADEIGCRWDAPELALEWPTPDPLMVLQRGDHQTYEEMCTLYRARREVLRGA